MWVKYRAYRTRAGSHDRVIQKEDLYRHNTLCCHGKDWRQQLLVCVALCPSPWSYYNGCCYAPSSSTYSQSGARTLCQKNAADLASVSDANELAFLWVIYAFLRRFQYYDGNIIILNVFVSYNQPSLLIALTDHSVQENHVISRSEATVFGREPDIGTWWIK